MKKRISIHAKESGDSQFLRDLLQRRIRVKKKQFNNNQGKRRSAQTINFLQKFRTDTS